MSRLARYLAPLLVPFALVVGIVLGAHPDKLPGFVRNPLVGDKSTRVVKEALDEVHSTYYRKIPDATLADAAVKGIVASLDDRFSNYFTPKEYTDYQASQDSELSGIGIAAEMAPQGIRVQQVYGDSPASRGGIQDGDLIVAVDGVALKGRSIADSSMRIRGPAGSLVKITISRKSREMTFTVTRATVSVPQVEARIVAKSGVKYGYVALAQFGEGAHGEVYQGLQKVLKQGAQGIVFDLRHNGGGLVTEAQAIASAFLPSGPIVTTRGRAVPARTLNATGSMIVPAKMPVVVLVDSGTASASEITAGALQDRHRAKLVGTKTFGKGVFQEVISLSNGGALDITAGQYFTPSGRNLGGKGVSQGSGLTPDVMASDDTSTPQDEGLDAGIETLATELGA